MMSGYLIWRSNDLSSSGTYGYFWASTPYLYTNSRLLHFGSTNVSPKDGTAKPYGFALRCVAFQSSPQPSSFGYVVGRSRLEKW